MTHIDIYTHCTEKSTPPGVLQVRDMKEQRQVCPLVMYQC